MVFVGLESLRQYGAGETIVVNECAAARWRAATGGGRGGAGGERSRGRAAGGANGRRALRGYEGRTETPPQNSQRVLLAKPRTAAVSHRHRGRCGAAARRRAGRSMGGEGAGGQAARTVRTASGRCGAMGTSRPTARPHGRCARNGARAGCERNGTATGRAAMVREGARPRGGGELRGGNGGRARCPHRAAHPHAMPNAQQARAVRTVTGRCGAMGTSRPTATGPHHGAR